MNRKIHDGGALRRQDMLVGKIKSLSLLILLSFAFCASIHSQMIDIVYLTTKGTKIVDSVSSKIKRLILFDSAAHSYRLAGVENLDDFEDLEEIDIYNVSGIKDYSFLCKAGNLKKLILRMCTISDLRFVEKLYNLEYLYLNILIPSGEESNIKNTPIDLSMLNKLKFINIVVRRIGVPNFINVRNAPVLSIRNCMIESFSERDVALLRQYSLIDVRFNPVATKEEEKSKLIGMNVIFYGTQPLSVETHK
jgi:hypothetical protein